MVEVGAHVLGVKVHGCLYGFLGACVVVNEYDDHNVVTNVTLPLKLCGSGHIIMNMVA